MGKVLSIINNKGGVCKTTTAISLGSALRRKGYNVLLVDLDGQMNLTTALRVAALDNSTYEGIIDKEHVNPVRVQEKTNELGLLDVLPSSRDLSAVDSELSGSKDRALRVCEMVESYRTQYDVIIIDTPPATSLLTINALYAADDCIICVVPEYLAVQGLIQMKETIEGINANRSHSIKWNVLITKFDKRKGMHRQTIESIEAAKIPTYNAKIRENVALAESSAVGTDIFSYAPKSKGSEDYAAFADEVIEKNKLKKSKKK